MKRAFLFFVPCLVIAGQAMAVRAAEEGPYLRPARVPDGIAILPPPPATDSPTARAQREIFLATRKLRGTARWKLATDDVTNAPLDRYACALGMQLTRENVPALARLLDRAGTGALVDPVKKHYQVRRPFLDAAGVICEPITEHLSDNGDYPSGHAANGWLEALILTALFPDRASAILTRGRAYGESRAVCGSHSASAVAAGWMAGSAMFAALQAAPDYRRDFDAAVRELTALGASAPRPDPRRCDAERVTLAEKPW